MKNSPVKAEKILNAIIILLAVIYFIPLYLSVINIFKPTEEIRRTPFTFHLPPFMDNIITVLTDPNVNIWEMYFNSLCIMLFGTAICLLVSAMAAYYLARRTDRGAKLVYVYFLFGLMVPYVIVYVPLVNILSRLHIPTNLPALIFVFVSGSISFSVFMYYAFIQTLPRDIEEAAIVDGAGQWVLFFRIVMPLIKPCTTTVAIFIGLSMWNDFLTPLLIGQIKTITVGIYTAIGPYASNWGSVFAYVMFATLPIAVVYVLAQKQFISGLTAGALKG